MRHPISFPSTFSPYGRVSWLAWLLVLLLSVSLLACEPAPSTEAGPSSNAASTSAAGTDLPVNTDFLTAEVWNDGQAEVAFYQIERTQNQYGQPADQSFVAGTYLVKQEFSREAMSKVTDGSGVSAFKSALFYEFESGSYQYKRNWVVNAQQSDLAPLKQSFTSFDWCSNRFEEMRYAADGSVEYEMRSDDYGNAERVLDGASDAVPPALVPLLVRGLALEADGSSTFSVLRPDGEPVNVTTTHEGTEPLEVAGRQRKAERITLTYDAPVASPVGEQTGTTETYWLGTGDARLLLKMSGDGGRYTMTLIEELRTPYWSENLWPRLDRVTERP
jgi:hypothetical protein